MADPAGEPDLGRFVAAQATVYSQALAELRAGAKRGHWMWFVFPQIAGLGRSLVARLYAIADRVEAEAYARHPVLGPRLVECTQTLLAWAGQRGAEAILGPVDTLKLKSSLTLFEACAPNPLPFATALNAFFDGNRDALTLAKL